MSKQKELASSIFFLVLGVALFIGSFFVNRLAGSNVGPEFLPRIIGVLMSGMSLSLLISAIKMPSEKTEKSVLKTTFFQKCANNRDVVTILLIMAYVFSIETLGFILSTILYLFLQMTLFRDRTKKIIISNLIISVIATVIVYCIFVMGLNLLLPSGILF